MANINKTKVVTGINTRLSYFHGWEPVSINGGDPKYSVSVLIPKTDKETVSTMLLMQLLKKALLNLAVRNLIELQLNCP